MRFTWKTLLFVITGALFIQALVISYNLYTGYFRVAGAGEFLFRLLYGSVFTTIAGSAIVWLDGWILRHLDLRLPWSSRPFHRFVTEFVFGSLAGVFLGGAITWVAHSISPYHDGLGRHLLDNGLIAAAINLIVVAALEGLLAFRRGDTERRKAETLQRENTQIRLEVLKDQLNPHFLFNSLNVLSSLITIDPDRARQFVDEFSAVYRYTLDVIDSPVVTLEREIAYARSYLYLQELRFQHSVTTEMRIDDRSLEHTLPPLALQTTLENAFKHNHASPEAPLHIRISTEDGVLVVTNTLRPKRHGVGSQGIGLDNLRKRYRFVCGRIPEFIATADQFVARLPLLSPE